jgi:sortase A
VTDVETRRVSSDATRQAAQQSERGLYNAPPAASSTPVDGTAPRAARPVRLSRADIATIINRGLLTFAAAVLAFGFFLVVPSALQHGRSQAGLVRRFRAELATQRAPIGGLIPNGVPVALIEIPAIGVHEIVVQGTTSGITRAGPGHLAASVLPGQLGNSVLIGRRTAYGGPFRRLPSVRVGDAIRVTTGQGTARYTVVSEGPKPSGSAEPMLPTTEGRLTLVTSDPLVFASRYRVAVASLQSAPFAATGHTSRIARADLGLTGDPTATATVFVWLLFAALVGAAAVVAFRRAPRTSAWLIVVPLVLAATWLVFENLVVLLPASL